MKTNPVVVFCYKRLDHLKQTIASLQQNYLAPETDLYVFSDAKKNDADASEVDRVRAFLETLTGFKSISIFKAPQNKGLANSIIEGVSTVLKEHSAAIVLEDDLLTSRNFLDYMNASLEHYQNNSKVFSVAGYSFPIGITENYSYDNYFTKRGSSWGWATWRDRWESIDWSVADYPIFEKDKIAQKEFNRMGSDLSGMLAKQMSGKINSWAIRWCYHQFKSDTYTAYPLHSKVENIGFGTEATHTSSIMKSRFNTVLDSTGNRHFHLQNEVSLNPVIIKQFINRYSIFTRLKYKAMGYIFR